MEGPRKLFVLVVWDDAHATLDELSDEDVRKAHIPTRIHTRGWAVRSNEVGITMAMEWLPSAESGTHDTWRGLTFIPRAMIVEETSLNLHRPRKPRKPKENVDGTSARTETPQ